MFKTPSTIKPTGCSITTWEKFARQVRSKGENLLARLDEFPNSVMVTGCQRSGTTMLTRVITRSEGMINYQFVRDDELAAALILCGHVEHSSQGRYCFQTTYLNERYKEYFEHNSEHKVIWVLRNPFSVVYSLLYNWKRFAFNELFDSCGAHLLEGKPKRTYELLGHWGVDKVLRACLSYTGKTAQVFDLRARLPQDQLLVIDYDNLVRHKARILPFIYDFIGLPYKEEYGDMINSRSLGKANRLSASQQSQIRSLCMPLYEKAITLVPKYT